MTTTFSSALKALNLCNKELHHQCQQGDWETCASLIPARETLLEKIRNSFDEKDNEACQLLSSFYQDMLKVDHEISLLAEKGKKDIANKLTKLKHAEKALPAYQAYTK